MWSNFCKHKVTIWEDWIHGWSVLKRPNSCGTQLGRECDNCEHYHKWNMCSKVCPCTDSLWHSAIFPDWHHPRFREWLNALSQGQANLHHDGAGPSQGELLERDRWLPTTPYFLRLNTLKFWDVLWDMTMAIHTLISAPIHPSVYASIRRSVYPTIHLSVYPCMLLSVSLSPFLSVS